jgi:spore coat polysaccharide biosynthesis protein SpsF
VIYAIIQARMGSTRLPGKVMLDLCGSPVIEHVINRLNKSNLIDEIIIATSTDSNNQPLIDFCINKGVSFFVGSEDDVLDRYYQTAIDNNVEDEDILIRITSDCPLIDPFVVDKVIQEHISSDNDYTTNVLDCTYPDGLDCEVFNFSTLKDTWLNANLSSQREHVTLYIRDNPDKFKLGNVKNDVDLSDFRWTLDEKEDFVFIEEVYNNLFDKNSFFTMEDIVELLNEKPELLKINSKFDRNEGLIKSLKEDEDLGSRNVNE